MAIVIPDLSGLGRGVEVAGGALAGALENRAQNRLMQQQRTEKQKSMEVLSDWASSYDPQKSPMENVGTLQSALQENNVDPSIMQPILQDIIKKSASQQGDIYGASQVFGGGQPQAQAQEGGAPVDRMAKFSNQDLVSLTSSPNRIVNQSAKSEIEKRKLDQQVSESDRKYHTQFAAKQEEKIAGLREALPRKKAALRHARGAVESGQVGSFSINQLADSVGGAVGDLLRTTKGAQLATAGKENLLGNMARVSAKAQNQWFEQRLASMFPKVGQSMEANLAVQEMLEGELSMEEAYLKKFDELATADEALYGYSRKDVDRRARKSVEHLEDLSFNRSSYRMRQLEESEMGPEKMRKSLMKKVPQGTPMTLERGAMFMRRFNDPKLALENAKKLGYRVPNGEDIQMYLLSSEEFSERMGNI